jgi:hypothetical protein
MLSSALSSVEAAHLIDARNNVELLTRWRSKRGRHSCSVQLKAALPGEVKTGGRRKRVQGDGRRK